MDLFDGHCDTVSRCWREGWSLRSNPGNVDLERGGRFGAWGQFFALFAAEEDHPGVALEEVCRAQYTLFQREMAQNKERMVHCRTGEEARAAFAAGKGAAFLSVEGAQLLGCSLEGLERALGPEAARKIKVVSHANYPQENKPDFPVKFFYINVLALLERAIGIIDALRAGRTPDVSPLEIYDESQLKERVLS